MKNPMLYSADQIKNWNVDKKCVDQEGNEYWIPARPEGMYSLKSRFILAWKVFSGKCDALYWMDD